MKITHRAFFTCLALSSCLLAFVGSVLPMQNQQSSTTPALNDQHMVVDAKVMQALFSQNMIDAKKIIQLLCNDKDNVFGKTMSAFAAKMRELKTSGYTDEELTAFFFKNLELYVAQTQSAAARTKRWLSRRQLTWMFVGALVLVAVVGGVAVWAISNYLKEKETVGVFSNALFKKMKELASEKEKFATLEKEIEKLEKQKSEDYTKNLCLARGINILNDQHNKSLEKIQKIEKELLSKSEENKNLVKKMGENQFTKLIQEKNEIEKSNKLLKETNEQLINEQEKQRRDFELKMQEKNKKIKKLKDEITKIQKPRTKDLNNTVLDENTENQNINQNENQLIIPESNNISNVNQENNIENKNNKKEKI